MTIKQVISWLKSIILLSINIVIYILIIRNMRKIWYRKLLRDSSGALISGAEIKKTKSYLYSIAGNIIKNTLQEKEGNNDRPVAGYRR